MSAKSETGSKPVFRFRLFPEHADKKTDGATGSIKGEVKVKNKVPTWADEKEELVDNIDDLVDDGTEEEDENDDDESVDDEEADERFVLTRDQVNDFFNELTDEDEEKEKTVPAATKKGSNEHHQAPYYDPVLHMDP